MTKVKNISTCRFCATPLQHTFADLGLSPLCQNIIAPEQLGEMEPFYPLHAYVCEKCFLVQLEEFVSPDKIFTEYAYFSSFADTWLKHAKDYTDLMVEKFGIGQHSKVVEIASNDGYLLQYFVQKGVPVLGVEPAANVAKVAIEKGIPSTVKFFGVQTATELAQDGKADLLLGNNVLAHVPNLHDFVGGMKIMLKSNGVITMEFPHLLRLMQRNQFDTIYHEHFSYLSFSTVEKFFAHHGITLFDVDELTTHGGSIRIYGRHTEDTSKPVTQNVVDMKTLEEREGLLSLPHYFSFAEKVKETKRKLLDFLIKVKREGKTIAGYGAAGKTNTLLNYCAIRTDFLDFTADRNTYKQGKYLPGSRIPVFGPEKIMETKPDYIFIGAWNLKEEIMQQLSFIREWGGKFIVPIPEAKEY